MQKCFGAIKHFRSSTPHTSLDGSRIIKAIQTQNKALINTPSSGFEVRLRLKYLLIYIVVQVIVSCELFPIDKIQEQSRLEIAAAKKGGNSLWTRPYAVLLCFSFVQRTDTHFSSVSWKYHSQEHVCESIIEERLKIQRTLSISIRPLDSLVPTWDGPDPRAPPSVELRYSPPPAWHPDLQQKQIWPGTHSASG